MPHIVLEIGDYLEKLSISSLFKDIHQSLSSYTDIETCKSRLLKTSHSFLGSGTTKKTFAHINLHLLPGRTEIQKQEIQSSILNLLEKHIVPLSKENGTPVDLSVHLEELTTYAKKTY